MNFFPYHPKWQVKKSKIILIGESLCIFKSASPFLLKILFFLEVIYVSIGLDM